MEFYEEAEEQLKKFCAICTEATRKFQEAEIGELDFHKEVKKYRKEFNHMIEEYTRLEKIRVIKEVYETDPKRKPTKTMRKAAKRKRNMKVRYI